MKKYLIFVFLVGFVPFSFLNPVEAMEAMGVDREDALSNPVSTQQRRYVVSPKEDEKPLSNSDLRTLHPINDLHLYGNLDEVLYQTTMSSEELKYNSSLASAKWVLEILKQFGKRSGVSHSKVEKDALAHLFLAASSLLDGTNGMEKNRPYGAELMARYFEETHPWFKKQYKVLLEKLSKDPTYSVSAFVKEFQTVNRKLMNTDPFESLRKIQKIQMRVSGMCNDQFYENLPYLLAQEGGREILKELLFWGERETN
jgi:hypothetical protein